VVERSVQEVAAQRMAALMRVLRPATTPTDEVKTGPGFALYTPSRSSSVCTGRLLCPQLCPTRAC
jgi:hypothetical protein